MNRSPIASAAPSPTPIKPSDRERAAAQTLDVRREPVDGIEGDEPDFANRKTAAPG